MLIGLCLLSPQGLSATFINMFNHGITKAALFMSLGVLTLHGRSSFYDSLQGLGKRMPVVCFTFLIGGLSLAGIPGTAGFISKWMLVKATLEAELPILAIFIILSSLLAIVYIWKVIECIYFTEPASTITDNKISLRILLPVWFLSGSCIYFGFDTGLILDASETVATSFFENGLEEKLK
tara:strand:- start:595 stop:1134 length:540 start_codon:yes stop_codon:yes gene_type:complete